MQKFWITDFSFIQNLTSINPDTGIQADSICMRFCILSIRRSFGGTNITNAPFGTAPYSFIFTDISSELGTRIESVGDMSHSQHILILKRVEPLFIFSGSTASFDFDDFSFFNSKDYRCIRNLSKRRGNGSIKNNGSIGGRKIRNHIQLPCQEMHSGF